MGLRSAMGICGDDIVSQQLSPESTGNPIKEKKIFISIIIIFKLLFYK